MNIEELRAFCLKLPGVTEDVKWENDLCFLISDKMFCLTGLEPPFRASFKAGDKEFDLLVRREGIVPAPYLARAKWVQVVREQSLSRQEWHRYVGASYDLIRSRLPKSVQKGLASLKT